MIEVPPNGFRAMQIIKSYQNATHTRRLLVSRTAELGWDVREEYDTTEVAHAHYADWHRVERARQRFDLAALIDGGWTEVRN